MLRAMHLEIASLDEQRQRDQKTQDAWGGKLTPAQFLAREERLRTHAWARRAMTTWFLRDDDGTLLASCETYRMRSFLDGDGSDSFGIASVFTEPALRGRGHATRLMDLVIERVRHDSPAAHAMLLFSDVGAAIYERSGYRTRPADDLLFPPAPGALAADALLDETEALAAFSTLEPPLEPFVIWPARDQLDWHLERARTYAALLGRPLLPHAGARIGDSVIVWAADWKHDRLQVLLLASSRGHEAEALVRAARRCAAAADLNEVRLWAEPWDFVGRDDLGGDRVARRDSLPMLAPLLPSLRPEMWRRIPRAVWM
jgi:GNAT superfamily N-acetyltransferase